MKPATPDFAAIDYWVFDLDNTLYPRTCNLFAQIDSLITRYVMDLTGLDHATARALQKAYYRDHGTTLNGLMKTHSIDPDHYLAKVHAIDYSPVRPHPELIETIDALPGRKFILTNADRGHTDAVLARLGGGGLFTDIFDIRAMGFAPKPSQSAYDLFLAAYGIDPQRAIMFDDLEKNLLVPHAIGMTTVQVVAEPDFAHQQVESWELDGASKGEHVHHVTADLKSFLRDALS